MLGATRPGYYRSMHKSLIAALGVLVIGCSGGATAPGGVEEDTGAATTSDGAVDDTASTGGDTSVTPGEDTGGTPTDSDTPPGDTAGGCPETLAGTQAVHVMMNVTWPGTVGTAAGSGIAHVWTKSVFKIEGTKITATNAPCGSQVPDIVKNPIAGGGKTLVEFPPAVWNAAAMPTFTVTGTQAGFAVGSAVTMAATPVLVGLTMTDPNAAWPALADIKGADHDGDGKLGITAVPRDGGGYSLPPTSLLQTSHADRLYIASRNTVALSGTRDTCTSMKGTATVTHFDNHVIGCRVKGGGDCSQAQYKFIDDNRTVYKVASATYETKVIAEGANCDAVRAALPAK